MIAVATDIGDKINRELRTSVRTCWSLLKKILWMLKSGRQSEAAE